MRQENAAANAETRQANAPALLDLRNENTAAHLETRRHFDETAKRLSAENRQYFEVATEAFQSQVQLIAEKVLGLSDELRREAADIRLEMRTGFADTQAMIKFSHAELDRRVSALENREQAVERTLAEVQARLDRLEASTH